MERRRVKRPRRGRAPALDFDDVIYGIHAVDEALAAGEALRALHVAARPQEGSARCATCSSTRRSETSPCASSSAPSSRACPSRRTKASSRSRRRFRMPVSPTSCEAHRDGARRFSSSSIISPIRTTSARSFGPPSAPGPTAIVLPERRSAGRQRDRAQSGGRRRRPACRSCGSPTSPTAIRRLKKEGILGRRRRRRCPRRRRCAKPTSNGDLALVIGAEGAGLAPASQAGVRLPGSDPDARGSSPRSTPRLPPAFSSTRPCGSANARFVLDGGGASSYT